MNSPRSLVVVCLLACSVALAGCGGGGGGGQDLAPLPAFVDGVAHPYLPLVAGRVWTYEGTDDGQERRQTVTGLEDRRRIVGVDCTALYQEVFLDGVLSERSWEWYAQDEAGNVWKFGEESFELEEGAFVRQPDSWIAGQRGAWPWLAFGADLRVGDLFEGGPPGAEDAFLVESLTDVVDVLAGRFEDCLRMLENPDDPADSDIVLYAPGIGLVVEQFAEGRIELTAVFQNAP